MLAKTGQDFTAGNYDAAKADAQKLFLEDARLDDPKSRQTAIANDFSSLATMTAKDPTGLAKLGLPDMTADLADWQRSWAAPSGGSLSSTTTDATGLQTQHFSLPGYQSYDVQPGIGHHSKQVGADGTTTDEYINGHEDRRVTNSPDGTERLIEELNPKTGDQQGPYSIAGVRPDGTSGGNAIESYEIDGSRTFAFVDPKTHRPTGFGETRRDGHLVQSWAKPY
jgi:hypothetical protein